MFSLILLAFCLLVYLPCLMAMPFWDDTMIFNHRGLAEGTFHKSVSYCWTKCRWPVLASFSLTFRAFQKIDPPKRPFYVVPALHLANVLIHWMNALLLWEVARLSGLDEVQAAIAALIFTVHPLAGSAVAPMVTRSALLSTSCIFASALFVLDGVPSVGLAFALLAVWMKEDAVVAPLLWIVLTATLSPWSLLWMVGVLAVLHRPIWLVVNARIPTLLKNNGDEGMGNAGLETSLPLRQYIPTTLVENLWRWPFWAIGLYQNGDPLPKTRIFRSWAFVFGLTALLGLIVAGILSPFPVKLALLLILISPWVASWFFKLPDPISELRAYSTVGGLALLAGYFLPSPMVLIVVSILSVMCLHRAWSQADELRFWMIAWNGGSKKLKVAINIAACYQRMGDLDEAAKWHQQALEFAPNNGLVYTNLGLCEEGRARMIRKRVSDRYAMLGYVETSAMQEANEQAAVHLKEAVKWTQQGLERCPNDPNVVMYAQAVWNHAAALGLCSLQSIA